MNKLYSRIEWENEPSDKTPLNEENLNKMDSAIESLDNRVIEQDSVKATKTEVSSLISNIFYNDSSGVITVYRKNGSFFEINAGLSKIAVNFDYDPSAEAIILTLQDGSRAFIDLSALITEFEFDNSDTISFNVEQATGRVSAVVNEGSIKEKHLEPDYLAQIKVQAAQAKLSSENALQACYNAEENAVKSESYAVGGTHSRTGEDEDNAQYYSEKAKAYADTWIGSLLPQGQITFSAIPTAGVLKGHMYQIMDRLVTDYRFEEGSGYSYPAGTCIYYTENSKWKCLSGVLTRELTQEEYDVLSESDKCNGTLYYITDGRNNLPVASYTQKGLVQLDKELSEDSENPVVNKVIAKRMAEISEEAKNPQTVNGHTIESNVPENAKFTDTTYSEFVKSGSGAEAGLVPAPPATAGTSRYLREDGTWSEPPMSSVTKENVVNALGYTPADNTDVLKYVECTQSYYDSITPQNNVVYFIKD